jgi:hypothetical protein
MILPVIREVVDDFRASTSSNGRPYNTIPDAVDPTRYGIVEIKSGRYISATPQIQAQANLARDDLPYTIFVGPNSTVSQRVRDNATVERFIPGQGIQPYR